jgi:hypothetical protein
MFNALHAGGLLNADTPDLRDLMTNKLVTVLKCYCTSRTCIQALGLKYNSGMNGRIEKDITDQSISECPDCQHILFWKQVKVH